MHKVTVWSEFSAAHFLREYKGNCEKLHGHNWKVSLTVSSKRLTSKGIVIDFKDLRKMLGEALKELDHSYLNELSSFKKNNPTSENIAVYIYKHIQKRLKSKDCKVADISVWETDKSCATFTGR